MGTEPANDPTPESVDRFPAEGENGDRDALDEMLPLVYDELRRLARRYLSLERPSHTLQPTALLHEAYMRLRDQRRVEWTNRSHFLGLAARMMRRILINYARDRAVAKRGGQAQRISLSLVADPFEKPEVDVIALNEALERLALLDSRKGEIVELKFFGGLTIAEIAEVTQLSAATVEREWKFARAWLFQELKSRT